MPKNPSLTEALQAFGRSSGTATLAPVAVSLQRRKGQPGSATQAPSRRGKKALIGYFDPSVSLQLKRIALEEDSSVQRLLGEALDLLFQSRGKPTIAQ